MKCLALDFGGSSVKYCLMDENTVIENQSQVPAPLSSPEQYGETVTSLYTRFNDQIEGIAISMPGQVDPETGFAFTCGGYLKLYGLNLFDVIHARLPDVRLSIENDGRCGALAEVWKGALQDCRDAVAVILGSGVGGGIIKGRRAHHGKSFGAGDFSLLLVSLGDYTVNNILLSYCGMLGLLLKTMIAKNVDLDFQDDSELLNILTTFGYDVSALGSGEGKLKVKVDGIQFFKWLEEGDPAVINIYQEFIQGLAMLAINIEILYDPDRIVFGGGLSRQTRLVQDIRREMDKFYRGSHSDLLLSRNVDIASCKFLAEANLVGAMYNYLIHYYPALVE
jgi:predicted NBD/HSP70 family sugar kinase